MRLSSSVFHDAISIIQTSFMARVETIPYRHHTNPTTQLLHKTDDQPVLRDGEISQGLEPESSKPESRSSKEDDECERGGANAGEARGGEQLLLPDEGLRLLQGPNQTLCHQWTPYLREEETGDEWVSF